MLAALGSYMTVLFSKNEEFRITKTFLCALYAHTFLMSEKGH